MRFSLEKLPWDSYDNLSTVTTLISGYFAFLILCNMHVVKMLWNRDAAACRIVVVANRHH